MKKLNAFIIVLSSLLLLLPVLSSACKTAQPTAPTQPATSAPTTPTASVQEPIELSLAGSSPLTSPTAESIDRWINKVSKESNGLLKIRHFPGSTLLPTPDIHPGVMAGAADLGSSLPYKPQPRLDAALAMAGLITGQNHESSLKIFEDLWSRFPDVWEDQWKDVKLIYLTVITPSILSTVNKPVRTPEDLKGLEIRTPDAFTSGLYKNLGATPVVIPTGDLAIALQKGTVDGIAFSTAGLVDFSLGELMKNATYFTSGTGTMFLIMNIDSWNKLPPDLQKVIEDSKEWAKQDMIQTQSQIEKDCEDYIKSFNWELIKLSDNEYDRWIAAARPAYDRLASDLNVAGFPGTDMVNYALERAKFYR